ncbi:hypothetical protein FCJ57_11910, partial [Burkholderia diffusa]|nr:hypothetical protein [Burkholderia diffusa]
TETIDTNTPVGRFTFHMIAALAEFERSLISERTRAGLASARQRGSRLGRPPALDVVERQHALALLVTHTEAQVADMLQVHSRTLRRSLGPAHHYEYESWRSVQKPCSACLKLFRQTSAQPGFKNARYSTRLLRSLPKVPAQRPNMNTIESRHLCLRADFQ